MVRHDACPDAWKPASTIVDTRKIFRAVESWKNVHRHLWLAVPKEDKNWFLWLNSCSQRNTYCMRSGFVASWHGMWRLTISFLTDKCSKPPGLLCLWDHLMINYVVLFHFWPNVCGQLWWRKRLQGARMYVCTYMHACVGPYRLNPRGIYTYVSLHAREWQEQSWQSCQGVSIDLFLQENQAGFLSIRVSWPSR